MFIKRSTLSSIITVNLLVGLLLSTVASEQPSGWRGDGTGLFTNTNPVINWSASKNINWQTPLSTFSNSQPIILNGRLYIGAEIDKLLCIDAETGKLIWERTNSGNALLPPAQRAEREKIVRQLQPNMEQKLLVDRKLDEAVAIYRKDRKKSNLDKIKQLKKQQKKIEQQLAPLFQFMPNIHEVSGYSTPTPVTDGKNIYVCYGTGLVAAYTPEGKRLWLKFIERPTIRWGYSSSPVLADGKLIIAYKDIIALDPQTGNELWRVPSKYRWGSPLVAKIADKAVIITPNGELIRVADGVLLSKSLPSLGYNSGMVHKNIVYTFNKNRARAHSLPKQVAAGAQAKLLWEVPITSDIYYGSPVTDGNRVYGVTRKGKLTALALKDGKKIFERKIKLGKGTYYPSPTIAGNNLFISSDNGKTVVLKLDATGSRISLNSLPPFRSSPVFIGNKIYIRTLNGIYCIGRP